MKKIPLRFHLRLVIPCLACALICWAAASGNTAPSQSPATASNDPLSGLTDIRSMIQTTETSTMETSVRDKALGMYREALAFAEETSQWSERHSDLQNKIARASKDLQSIRKSMKPAEKGKSSPIDPETDLEDLARRLTDLENQLGRAHADSRQAEEDLKKKSAVITDNPKQLARITDEIDKLSNESPPSKAAKQPPEIEQAHQTWKNALLALLTMKKNVLEAELAYYDGNGELLIARRDFSDRQADRLEKTVLRYRKAIGERRLAEASADARKARQTILQSATQHPMVRALADRNAALAEERNLLPARIQEAQEKLHELNQQVERITGDLALTRDQASAARFSQSVGMLLRTQRAGLPDLRIHRRDRDIRESTIADVQIRVVELLGRQQAGVLKDDFQEMLARFGIADLASMPEIESELMPLWETYRETTYKLWEDYNRYLKLLVELDIQQGVLIQNTQKYARFINEHILWTQSRQPLRMADISNSALAFVRLTDIRRWAQVPLTLFRLPVNEYLFLAAALIVFLILLYLRQPIRGRLKSACQADTVSFTDTLLSLVYSFLLALPWPLLMAALGRILTDTDNPRDPFFVKACGSALLSISGILMGLLFLRHIIKREGPADSHFNWHPEALPEMRKALMVLIAAGLPIFFAWTLMNGLPTDPVNESLNVFIFSLGMLTIIVCLNRLFHPRRGAVRPFLETIQDKNLYRWRWVCFIAVLGLPLFLLILAFAGYEFTAVHLAKKLLASLFVLIFGGIIFAVITRWLAVMHRKISAAEVQKRIDPSPPLPPPSEAATRASGHSSSIDNAGGVNLPHINLQTRKLIRTVLFLSVAAAFWFIWAAELPALGFLRRFHIGIGSMTLVDLGLTFLTIFLTVVATRNIPGLLEIGILQYLSLETGSRYAITTISRYILVILGITTAFGFAGVGWAQVQWIAAAVTVGLGFGLQEIFSNFISGLIILFERPIRVGDTVTIGATTGTVTRIRIRATTILDWDYKEMVIPNKNFVTGEIVNWTLSDPILRLVMPIGIAYGSDTRKARDLLLEIARSDPQVLYQPGPRALFISFGDSTLNFELRVYVKGIDDLVQARHAILTEIHERFKQAGIEIAFPQHDLHLRSMDGRILADLRATPEEKQPSPASDCAVSANANDLQNKLKG